jgi:hypothetical protein
LPDEYSMDFRESGIEVSRGGPPGGPLSTYEARFNARLVNEFSVGVSPVLFGARLSLFVGVDQGRISLDIVEAIDSRMVTHLSYAVGTK